MHKITFRIESGEDVSIFAADGEGILGAARKANVLIDAPCSGNGTCGKCQVRLLEGTVKTIRSHHITDEESAEGWRLACVSSVSGDAVILVPDIVSAYKSRIKVADLSTPTETSIFRVLQERLKESGLKHGCGLLTVEIKLDPPTLDDTMPDNERFSRAAAEALGLDGSQRDGASIPYSVTKKLPEILRNSDFHVKCLACLTCLSDSNNVTESSPAENAPDNFAEILDLQSKDDESRVCGLAIDIGTTTVSGLLVDLFTREILAKLSAGNDQIRYGADVINRIIEQQKPGGAQRLQQAIIADTLLPLIDGMCACAKIAHDRIFRMTVASNTTMNHLLLGINANFLRMEPYIPAFFELDAFDPSQVGIDLAPTAKMSLAPNIGSYVGGDVTAGTLACMMWDSPEMSLLIDLGTNGEIVFGNSDFLMACACSAGPAFEGGDVSCGMRATDGAVEACVIDAETMEPELTVIGGEKPVGLCGSGLIDVVAELFHAGIINGKGKFDREGERIRRDEYGTGRYVLAFADASASGRDITISEVDIDNFIRAKGAIFSGVMSLITPLGFTPEDIEKVMVAGGIGSGINIKNAIRIGMLPALPEDKYCYIGNSSLSGAYATLVSSDAKEKLREVAKNMTYVELSTQPGYMDEFIAACFLPHTDETLFKEV